MELRATVLVLLLIFSGTGAVAEERQADLVGTWKWISADGKSVSYPFYMRLSPDGKASTWPAPEDWPNTVGGISRGVWSVRGGYFIIVRPKAGENRKSRFQIKDNLMTAITDEGVHLVYRRILPDLEPGELDEAAAREAKGLKDADLVGTWMSVSVNGEAVDAPTYMRFFAGGKASAWPAPAGSGTSDHGVSLAKWSLEKGYLLYDAKDNGAFKAWITIGKNEVTIVTEDQTESIFRRVVPDLEPGKISDK